MRCSHDELLIVIAPFVPDIPTGREAAAVLVAHPMRTDSAEFLERLFDGCPCNVSYGHGTGSHTPVTRCSPMISRVTSASLVMQNGNAPAARSTRGQLGAETAVGPLRSKDCNRAHSSAVAYELTLSAGGTCTPTSGARWEVCDVTLGTCQSPTELLPLRTGRRCGICKRLWLRRLAQTPTGLRALGAAAIKIR